MYLQTKTDLFAAAVSHAGISNVTSYWGEGYWGYSYNAIAAAGGKWVVLSPEGFHERWHPGRQYEKFCAEGRMLFLSLYPVMDRQPTKQELYHRCHEMGDIAVAGLGNAGRKLIYALADA